MIRECSTCIPYLNKNSLILVVSVQIPSRPRSGLLRNSLFLKTQEDAVIHAGQQGHCHLTPVNGSDRPLGKDWLFFPPLPKLSRVCGFNASMHRTASGHPRSGFWLVAIPSKPQQQCGSWKSGRAVTNLLEEGVCGQLHPQVAFTQKAPGQLPWHLAKQATAIDQDSSQLGSERVYHY